MHQRKAPHPALLAAIAAVAAVMALGWTAAESGRGLDGADFRMVVIVTAGVWLGAHVLGRATR